MPRDGLSLASPRPSRQLPACMSLSAPATARSLLGWSIPSIRWEAYSAGKWHHVTPRARMSASAKRRPRAYPGNSGGRSPGGRPRRGGRQGQVGRRETPAGRNTREALAAARDEDSGGQGIKFWRTDQMMRRYMAVTDLTLRTAAEVANANELTRDLQVAR